MDQDFDHGLSAMEVPKTVLFPTGNRLETDSGENSTVDFKCLAKSSASKSPNDTRSRGSELDCILVIGNCK